MARARFGVHSRGLFGIALRRSVPDLRVPATTFLRLLAAGASARCCAGTLVFSARSQDYANAEWGQTSRVRRRGAFLAWPRTRRARGSRRELWSWQQDERIDADFFAARGRAAAPPPARGAAPRLRAASLPVVTRAEACPGGGRSRLPSCCKRRAPARSATARAGRRLLAVTGAPRYERSDSGPRARRHRALHRHAAWPTRPARGSREREALGRRRAATRPASMRSARQPRAGAPLAAAATCWTPSLQRGFALSGRAGGARS